MAVSFCGLELDVDGELTDDGEVILRLSDEREDRMLLTRKPLNGQRFGEAVRRQKEAALRSLRDARLIERTALKLAGRDARLFAHAGWSADGIDTRVLLAVIHAGEELVLLSAAGVGADYLRVRDAFESVLKGLREADGAT